MTAISYHASLNDLQAQGLAEAGPFARPRWFALLEEAGTQPYLACASDGDARVCLPLEKRNRSLVSLTNWYAFTWAPLHTGIAPDAGLLRALAYDLSRRSRRVVFDKLSVEDGTAALLATAFREAGCSVFDEHCDVNHVLALNGRSYADYLAQRPGQLRTTLKRKGRKVEVTLSQEFDAQDWAAYEDIYADSWKPEEGDPELLKRFAMEEAAAGRMRFGLARAEGHPVAAQFWTVENGTAYIHKLAHRESAKSLSPGTTLSAALFAQVIDHDKVDLVDFGTGDDGYKRDWMEAVRERRRLTCLRPGVPANWPELAKAAARKLVSAIRHG
ncbi:GNAT family N-acetyltransferase [Aurantiacibacter suaedae]|uniref:GNAT family N-acetyltransferase n=1 Tax=Aurantiacibacter suaedae TaxID=2545755 RepID=UPI0010F812F6|nr:GNAT family N-acetyltransferase [Aurantiacibacter suaedae]